MKRFESVALQVSGLNLQTATFTLPFEGTLTGVCLCAGFATVTNAAEYVAVVTFVQYGVAADIDANMSGKRGIVAAIRNRVSVAGAGADVMDSQGKNLYVPVRVPLKRLSQIHLQSNSATNGIVASAVLHFETKS